MPSSSILSVIIIIGIVLFAIIIFLVGVFYFLYGRTCNTVRD